MVSKSLKKITASWVIVVLLLFVVAIIFGITMRFGQGNKITLDPVKFYAFMTTHGLTMIGIWTVAGMAAVNYLLTRYIPISIKANRIAFVLTILGVLMLWSSTLLADYHAGWTFLYPLTYSATGAEWGPPVFMWSLTILGLGWLIWSISLLGQILKKYTFGEAMAWAHLRKNSTADVPPMILISTVTLIGIIVSLLAAVVLLVLLFAEYYSKGEFVNDPLIMKNMIYFFGHTIANETLYLGLATLYELMPEVSGKPKFKTTWYVALGWNCTLVFILTAFFHHLYMDFVQPVGFQVIGQLASYFASLPAAVVTVFSVISLIYKNKIKWNMTNTLFFLGVVGWVIGGIGALIDATITNNMLLHNTLWVPAHFHTYNAMGNVLFSMAFFYWLSNELSSGQNSDKYQRIKLILLLIGGFGFVLMFYLAGADSIPRRFSLYPAEFTSATFYASVGAWLGIVYLSAIVWMIFDIIKGCLKAFSPSY